MKRDSDQHSPRTIEELAEFARSQRHRPIWEVFEELAQATPDEELDKIPHDGSVNHDHYLYGTPKRVKT